MKIIFPFFITIFYFYYFKVIFSMTMVNIKENERDFFNIINKIGKCGPRAIMACEKKSGGLRFLFLTKIKFYMENKTCVVFTCSCPFTVSWHAFQSKRAQLFVHYLLIGPTESPFCFFLLLISFYFVVFLIINNLTNYFDKFSNTIYNFNI